MPDYIAPQIDEADDDPLAIKEDMADVVRTLVPGFELHPGTPEDAILQALAIEHSETRRAATGEGQTYDRIARWLGNSVFGFLSRDPTPAVGDVTFTVIDTSGYTVPIGTQLTLRTPDGSRVGFETTTAAVIATGLTVSPAVQIMAVDDGSEGNALSQDPRLEDEFDFIQSLTILAPTAGGDDGETDTEYLNRFSRFQRRMADTLITEDDFNQFARDFYADGGRAVTIPLYNSDTSTTDVPGHFTVVPITPLGLPRSGTEMADLKTAIDVRLPPGVVSHVISPVYTSVTVAYTATAYPPFDPATVQASATAALESFLSPATWGEPPYGDEPMWLNEGTIYANDLIGVLEGVEGLRRVVTLLVNGADRFDLVISGPVGLPSATVSGVVSGT